MNPEQANSRELSAQLQSDFHKKALMPLIWMRDNGGELSIKALPEEFAEFKGQSITVNIEEGSGKLDSFAGEWTVKIGKRKSYKLTTNAVGEPDINTSAGEPVEAEEKDQVIGLLPEMFDRFSTEMARKFSPRRLGKTSLRNITQK